MMPRVPKTSCWRIGALTVAVAVMSNCNLSSLAHDERPIPNEVKQVAVQREAVVAALLAQIDANGLFRYPAPNVTMGEMPFDTARAEAVAFLDYAQNTNWRNLAEHERGAFIEMGKLLPCGNAHLVRSKFEPPADSATRVLQIRLGDRWSIPFCGTRQTPEVVVTIATRSNDTRYRRSGVLGHGADEAMAYEVRGIPTGWGAEYVLTPEGAVNEAYAFTGVRTARLPEIVRANQTGQERINGQYVGPNLYCAMWRVTLERPVRMAAFYSLRRLDLSEVYVADSDCPSVFGRIVVVTPSPEQPATREFRAWTGDRSQVYIARFRSPVEFESVVIER